jgi:hypothetical protein
MRKLILAAIAGVLALQPPAQAADPVSPYDSGYEVGATHSHQGSIAPTHHSTANPASAPINAPINAPKYEYRNACGPGLNGIQATCPTNTCPPGEQIYRLWQVSPPPAAPMGLVCSGNGPPPVAAAPPQVTGAMVLQAFRRVPLPALRSHSQPANKTLINFDTIFFTPAQPLTRNITLLGQRVRLEIRPSRFEWVHGDGTTETTSEPGSPYPAKDIVYRYADAHRTVQHRVVVTWSAEYSLNGGPLQPVNGTVTTTGPATPLRIAEASPALSGSGH